MIYGTNDANLRMAARRRGYELEKKRYSYPPYSLNGYMIRDAKTKRPVAGLKYEMSAEDVRIFLNDERK